jgi:hypothetical protein
LRISPPTSRASDRSDSKRPHTYKVLSHSFFSLCSPQLQSSPAGSTEEKVDGSNRHRGGEKAGGDEKASATGGDKGDGGEKEKAGEEKAGEEKAGEKAGGDEKEKAGGGEQAEDDKSDNHKEENKNSKQPSEEKATITKKTESKKEGTGNHDLIFQLSPL